MAKDISEKRKHKRYALDSVYGKMLCASDITILNISVNGAAITTSRRLAHNREYGLKLKFEDTIVSLKGKVVWSILSNSKSMPTGEVVPVYRAGIQFTNVLTSEARSLISYIERNKTNSLDKRGVRFKVRQAGDATLDLPLDYAIKRISESGMLIGTDNPLDRESQHVMEIHLDSRIITVTARIVHCTELKTEGAARYDIGIEFLRISDEDADALKTFLVDIGKGV